MGPIDRLDVAAAARAQAEGALLLDVREQDEWDAGHAPGALHIPMSALAARIGEVPAAGRTLVVCRSGGRSETVAFALARAGRSGCANVEGGMAAWARARLPLVPDGGRII